MVGTVRHASILMLLLSPLLAGTFPGAASAPTVTVEWPHPDDVVAGEVDLTGMAGGAQGVEVSIDGGPWSSASGAASWSFSWNASAAANGPHDVSVRSFNGTERSAVASVQVRVNNTPPSSLELTLGLVPDELFPGETFSASGLARFNTGVRAGGITVELEVDGRGVNATTERRGYYSADLKAPASPGTTAVTARARSAGLSGNASTPLTVRQVNPPDLSVAPADVSFSPAEPYGGQEVVISAIVRNLGGGNASARVRFTSPSLPTREVSVTVSGSWNAVVKWAMPPGNHTVTVSLEDISPPDSNSSNDRAEAGVWVRSAPDLTVEAVVFSNSRPREGTLVTLQARVRNLGDRQSRATVRFYDGPPSGGKLLAGQSDIVPANSSRMFLSDWNATAGTHVIHAVVGDSDPAESDTSNNERSRELHVSERPSPSAERAIPGLWNLPLALMVAMFLLKSSSWRGNN